jgi:hypothetical protein
MSFINFLLEATDAVLSWEIPEAGFAEAIKDQACLMAGINIDEMSQSIYD